MAVYAKEITIPKATPESNPAEVVLKPLNGLVKSYSFIFPPGAAGVVGVRLLDEGRQFAPVDGGWIYGNGEQITTQDNRKLQGPPYRVVIQGYSNAIDWPHTIMIRMEVI